MYGKNVKDMYLSYLSGNSEDIINVNLQLKPVRDMSSLFEKLAHIEEERGEDIAQINPAEYPRILFQIIKFQRFSYFQRIYQQLLDYREYVFEKQLIDIKYLFKGFQSYEAATSSRDLLVDFKNLQKEFQQETIFYTANDLYDYLNEQVYSNNITNIQNNEYLQSNSVISNDELTMLYVLLHYHGIDRDELCKINKKSDIVWLDNKDPYIIIKLRKYFIKGLTVNLLKKAAAATYVTYRRGRGYALQPLNGLYLFSYEDDDIQTESGFTKRSAKIANKFSKDCELAEVDSSTLSDIFFQGALYRVCEQLYKDGIEFFDLHIAQIFKKCHYNDSAKNLPYHVEIEVVKEVRERYQYLSVNDLWL